MSFRKNSYTVLYRRQTQGARPALRFAEDEGLIDVERKIVAQAIAPLVLGVISDELQDNLDGRGDCKRLPISKRMPGLPVSKRRPVRGYGIC
ncbi:hypothetical protein [Achromobacter aloeverae]